ncbi:MAG: Type 1 glutamine amidotransferase-like domain-containing protein [Candidatus Sericytochromatia bacterium]
MKGRIVFNGNIQLESDFIQAFQEALLDSQHADPQVRDSRNTLLITAAWQKRELDEQHIRHALYEIGLPIHAADGSDNIPNLGIYHAFNRLRQADPELYRSYHTKQQVVQQVKRFYREKNSGLIRILQKQLALLRETFPQISLAQVLAYGVTDGQSELPRYNPWQLLYHYACQDIQASIAKLREHDERMLQVCHEIDDTFFASSGVREHPIYLQMRAELAERLLAANSIFIFGGHIAVLFNRLNFFQLREVFVEALERGTNFYTVSAGSMSLCDYLVVFDDASNEWTRSSRMYDFELFDKGFGLVTKIQLFPHCKDYIAMEDPDTVAYTAARFNRSLCVGLDQRSFLQLETYRQDGKEYERFVSVGPHEGLYLFKTDGTVEVKHRGEELLLPGTRLWEEQLSSAS